MSEKNKIHGKSLARLMSVQALYSKDLMNETGDSQKPFNNDSIRSYLETVADEEFDYENQQPDKNLFRKITEKAQERKEELDKIIMQYLDKNWTLEKLSVLLRAILRAGTFEIIEYKSTPAKVIINEYVNIAKAFSGDEAKEKNFVNAVLDRVSKEVRK